MIAHARTAETVFLGTSNLKVCPSDLVGDRKVDGLSDMALSLFSDIISFCTLGACHFHTHLLDTPQCLGVGGTHI